MAGVAVDPAALHVNISSTPATPGVRTFARVSSGNAGDLPSAP